MNKLIYLLPFLFFISCQQNANKSVLKESKSVTISIKNNVVKSTKTIPFKKASNEGVLIGSDIKLLDEHLNEIKDISSLNGQIIQIIGVSDSTYKANPKEEHCQEFNYVKVKTKDLEGFVEGRKVYGFTKDEQTKPLWTESP